jgi:hypothetical protein
MRNPMDAPVIPGRWTDDLRFRAAVWTVAVLWTVGYGLRLLLTHIKW